MKKMYIKMNIEMVLVFHCDWAAYDFIDYNIVFTN